MTWVRLIRGQRSKTRPSPRPFCTHIGSVYLLYTLLLSAVLPEKGVLQEEDSSLLKFLHRTQDPQRTKS